jgi:protoporphyrinogen oxidase
MAIPGFVEFSRLRPTSHTIVYVPYYMPTHSPGWRRSDVDLIEEAFGYLKRINPSLTNADRIDDAAGRLRFAQPVCPPGFLAMIPKVQTPIAGLQVADTCLYYPEDRGVSESVRWGKRMAGIPLRLAGERLTHSALWISALAPGAMCGIVGILGWVGQPARSSKR